MSHHLAIPFVYSTDPTASLGLFLFPTSLPFRVRSTDLWSFLLIQLILARSVATSLGHSASTHLWSRWSTPPGSSACWRGGKRTSRRCGTSALILHPECVSPCDDLFRNALNVQRFLRCVAFYTVPVIFLARPSTLLTAPLAGLATSP